MINGTEDARKAALEFLKKHNAGVLATISRDYKPHASAVYYVSDDNFNIYFFTKRTSRKYDAISAHPQVAFTIGRLDVPQTLQIEGMASEIQGEDKAVHAAELMKKLEEVNQFYIPVAKMEGEAALMWLEPKWIRWGDFSAPGIHNADMLTEIPVQ